MVKSISRSGWNDAYCADSGPSRRGSSRSAIRPIEASEAAFRQVRNTSIRDIHSLVTNVRNPPSCETSIDW